MSRLDLYLVVVVQSYTCVELILSNDNRSCGIVVRVVWGTGIAPLRAALHSS